MSAAVTVAPRAGEDWARRIWLVGTIALTIGITALLIALGPSTGVHATANLHTVVLLGSSVHVAATAWFFTLPEVRAYARVHRVRYIVAPCLLVVGTTVLALSISRSRFEWFFVFYLAWQYWHYQKQNVGMTALAGVSSRSRSVQSIERRCIIATGIAGIAGLLAHPKLLGLSTYDTVRHVFPITEVVFAGAVLVGVWSLVRPNGVRRSPSFILVYLSSLLFFAPVFVFDSPFAAALSFAIAHGYQYLLLVGMLAGSRRLGRTRVVNLGLFVLVALVGGILLEHASNVTLNSLFERGVFGASLGVVMSHFVIDAGLWRLRDPFPRKFLTEHLPYLLTPTPK